MIHRLLCLLALALPIVAQAASPTALRAEDVATLLKPPSHGIRVLAIWALDCAYCESNLQALGRLQRAQPDTIELITIATDSIDQSDMIAARLHSAAMDAWPARAYTDATPERINYLIDPNWGGETPRTLVIRADGTRLGISGELTPAKLKSIP
ncbi:iron complex outermembrane recepter protein [Dyella sp. OK004]|uniref:hypothetical protein n=1 Tax=Dyella sp. OK004 TaxID=1855292 RepID=UPI0008F3B18F|nr:hypothetical protein [Dyella sp. OK004]SFS06155.1 iron complex outermembrane recepter protein [Dyella sp. OK004]